MASASNPALLKVKVQVMVGDAIAIGPGKADLLEAVATKGSIAAAGRCLGLSYRRTRDMIDTLNACWRSPLVTTVKGGQHGGGTSLTPDGRLVLERYRVLQRALKVTASEHGASLLELATDRADACRISRAPHRGDTDDY
ncbi:winged helix-turn-helix domain-containing protein [Novosphingobium sp. M1R2S20]|uniref:Winged helix-turn-helix domain-containing protein n=1 Tax=Novosphingobium rhizovicinum TaxID=3228928 RepID=A0ABV3RDR9_9SPHN